MSKRHRRARWSAAGALGAVAATVIALLALQVGHLDTRVGQLDQRAVSAAVQSALDNPEARTVALTSTSHPGAVEAHIVVLPSGTGYVIDSRLRRLPADRTYQLWGFEQGRTVSLGLLGNHPADVGFTQGNGAQITAYAVTSEVAGGVTSPTHVPEAKSAPLTADWSPQSSARWCPNQSSVRLHASAADGSW
jgi:hypothetical protein